MNKNRKPATGEARVATPALSFPSLLASLHKLVEQQCTQLVYSACIYLDKLVDNNVHSLLCIFIWTNWSNNMPRPMHQSGESEYTHSGQIFHSDFWWLHLEKLFLHPVESILLIGQCGKHPEWHVINLKSILEQIYKISYIQIEFIFFRLYKDTAHKEWDGHYMSHRTKACVVSFALIWKRKCCNWKTDIWQFTKCSGRKSLISLVGKKWKWLWSLYIKPKQSETSMIRN